MDRRTAKWRGNVSNQDSDVDVEDSESPTLSRPPRHRSNKSGDKKNRKRSDTVSSTQTSSTPTRTMSPLVDSENTPPASAGRRPLLVKTSMQGPTHRATSSRDLTDSDTIRKIASSASLSAARPPSPVQFTPSTPALSPGVHGTTDESDTDFQSAYSVSPQGSNASLEYNQTMSDEEHLENRLPDEFGKHPASVLINEYRRDRVSSTSTATATAIDDQTFSGSEDAT